MGIALAACCALLSGTPTAAPGQLLSPGHLAAAHSELEGLRKCTSCHELGQRGISAARCLACHEPLATRIEADRGYHATVEVDACADCHQDHLGEGFDLLRLDESAFDHGDTGYRLERSHALEECRSCHVREHVADEVVRAFKTERGALDRTYLGLSADCSSCHVAESPHGEQLDSRDCAECHDEGVWDEPSRFDHASTAFPLENLHSDIACGACHGEDPDFAVYNPLPHGSCGDCHDDPHAGALGASCASCHDTRGWASLDLDAVEEGFDHGATSFPLTGAHEAAACVTCHASTPPRTESLHMTYLPGTSGSSYPRPVAERCLSCHVTRHVSDPPGRWAECSSCHSETGWVPSPFGVAEHATSAFPLTGAHDVTPCVACHLDPGRDPDVFTLALPAQGCAACHAEDDPHDDRYSSLGCETCHGTDAFDVTSFDHDIVPGSGARACSTCHVDDNPHAGQFAGRDCSTCHRTTSFTVDDFDHGDTRFPLDGAHAGATCASCHAVEVGPSSSLVRYRPLGTECVDCHGGQR